MFAYLLNSKFEVIKIIDTFKSFIWTDRYQESGDFELCMRPTIDILSNAKLDYYLLNPESEHTMIIESNEITSDPDEGNEFIVSGRSLESILSRRIITNPITLDCSFQNGFKKIFNDAIISPTNSDRKISNFIYKESTDPRIVSLTISAQYDHEDLYSIVKEQCEDKNIGFKIVLNNLNQFVFSFYKGENRSYTQIKNPHVVFSPSFENISESTYTKDNSDLSNVAIVTGKTDTYGEVIHEVGQASGLNRREIHSDGGSISDKREDETVISKAEYLKLLENCGNKDLNDHKLKALFDGQAEPKINYEYGKDYFVGDVVEIENEYGIDGQSVVSEMIWSHDCSGITAYPTFEAYEEIQAIKDHSKLINRNMKNQHPIKSISGLDNVLNQMTNVPGFSWNESIKALKAPVIETVTYKGSGSSTNDHSKLAGRDAINQHSMNAISGLLNSIKRKASSKIFNWNDDSTIIFEAQLPYTSSDEIGNHSSLFNRDIDEQHDISSITGLVETLNSKADISNFEWNG